ncbi:hypothetical protein H311_01072 [Anncaliia algerae PRA109]|nr:hypothetical protein H311_01072 [Anncaliia algerae PRA109]
MLYKKSFKSLSLINSSLKSLELKDLSTKKYRQIEELIDLEATLKFCINNLKTLEDNFNEEIEEMKDTLAIFALKAQANTIIDSFALDEKKYCLCRSGKEENLIACDASECSIEWYHLDCIGLAEIPEDEWICDQCKLKK